MHCIISCSDRPNSCCDFQVVMSVSDTFICLPQCDVTGTHLRFPVGAKAMHCWYYCGLLPIFIMRGDTKFQSDIGERKDMLCFLPKFTDFCGAWTENTCLCLSDRHFSLGSLPCFPVGCNTLALVQTVLRSAAKGLFSKCKIGCHLRSTQLYLNHLLLLLG